MTVTYNLKGNKIVADDFVKPDGSTPAVNASTVSVAAYATSGITAGDLQTVLNALADRIKALEP